MYMYVYINIGIVYQSCGVRSIQYTYIYIYISELTYEVYQTMFIPFYTNLIPFVTSIAPQVKHEPTMINNEILGCYRHPLLWSKRSPSLNLFMLEVPGCMYKGTLTSLKKVKHKLFHKILNFFSITVYYSAIVQSGKWITTRWTVVINVNLRYQRSLNINQAVVLPSALNRPSGNPTLHCNIHRL